LVYTRNLLFHISAVTFLSDLLFDMFYLSSSPAQTCTCLAFQLTLTFHFKCMYSDVSTAFLWLSDVTCTISRMIDGEVCLEMAHFSLEYTLVIVCGSIRGTHRVFKWRAIINAYTPRVLGTERLTNSEVFTGDIYTRIKICKKEDAKGLCLNYPGYIKLRRRLFIGKHKMLWQHTVVFVNLVRLYFKSTFFEIWYEYIQEGGLAKLCLVNKLLGLYLSGLTGERRGSGNLRSGFHGNLRFAYSLLYNIFESVKLQSDNYSLSGLTSNRGTPYMKYNLFWYFYEIVSLQLQFTLTFDLSTLLQQTK